MSRFHETCPHLHAHYQISGFSVQLRNTNSFAKIDVDQTMEKTVNKDTQISGGTRGFSLKPGTVAYFYLMVDLKESALKELRHQISLQSHGKVSHTNLKRTQIQKMSLMFLVWLISWVTTGLTPLAEIHHILLV